MSFAFASGRRFGFRHLEKRADVRSRLAAWAEFAAAFDALIEEISAARRYGPTGVRAEDYERVRRAMSQAYPAVRPYLACYLRSEPEDAQWGSEVAGYSTDAYEALVATPDLESLLQADEREFFSRITRAREALNLYGEHLQKLAARGS